MNSIAEAFILGIVQGITEWLPVSSSGHLVLFQQWFSMQSDVFLDTMLHVATLVAVCFVFYDDLAKMARAIFTWDKQSEHFRLFWYVILATIPIVIVGYFLKTLIEQAFTSAKLVGFTLIITGIIIYFTKNVKENKELTPKNAFFIGLAQIIALLPGISRSGTTISTGMFLGLKRDEAARFSFLMFIPAITGAAVLQLASHDLTNLDGPAIFTGMLAAFAVSVVALRWLLGVIRNGKMHYFAYYCIILGIVALISSYVLSIG